MHFSHSPELWQDFPTLVPAVFAIEGVTDGVSVQNQAAPYIGRARERLASGSESEFPEIRAWRQGFTQMGLKPTQYRCASESLLRRFRKEGSLPELHPLIDLCNAISIAFATPIAVFDRAHIDADLEVRYATGTETYLTFGGEIERPYEREVIFADSANRAHARRWTNRQSGLSAIRPTTSEVLIVAEALHESAPEDMQRLLDALVTELESTWGSTPSSAILVAASPRFTV
jgi:DNA/RNA-binding domain of Phe-tRNA-synthetase-like protein